MARYKYIIIKPEEKMAIETAIRLLKDDPIFAVLMVDSLKGLLVRSQNEAKL